MNFALDHVTRIVDGLPSIRDVSLTLENGRLAVLLGPTLDKPTTGRVLVDGKDVTGIDVRKRSVAMVISSSSTIPLTVCENTASPLPVLGKPHAEIEKRSGAAKLLRLEPYLNRTPLELSGASSSAPRLRARW